MSARTRRPAVLDTGVLIHYARGDATYEAIEQQYGILDAGPEHHLLSSVVEGEALALAKYKGWGETRVAKLTSVVNHLVRIDAGKRFVVDAYVELYSVARAAGRGLGQNDLWIAATALATGAELYTCDDDFCFLAPEHITVHYIPVTR